MKPILLPLPGLLIATLVMGCGDNDTQTNPDAGKSVIPTSYRFDSRFNTGSSSVSYSGQVFRQLLIAELVNYIDELPAQVDTTAPADDEVLSALNFYFDFDSTTGGTTALALVGGMAPPALQSRFDDVSSDKNLREKLAGNDPATDHNDWNTPGNFAGWSEGGTDTDTPTELVQYWFGLIDDLAFARIGGAPLDPIGAPIEKVYITEKGQDLKQLIHKFLLGAVAFSQGHDDYLDDDVAGKGLLSPNTQDGDNAYSELEHAWDEGFGYFGAAQNYNNYTDDELAAQGGRDKFQGYSDTDNDDRIDLLAEFNLGNSIHCAKRDLGSSDAAPTDFTKSVFDSFIVGRHMIATASDALTSQQMSDLVKQRDIASSTWETCVAATVVHYINHVLTDMELFGMGSYSFENHAKHWSELKGFALALQFNPRSPTLEGTRFFDLHALIGDAPVLPNDIGGQTAIDQYKTGLLSARTILRDAYAFDQANVDGW